MPSEFAGSFASVPNVRHDISLCFDAVTVTRGKRTILDRCSGIVEGGRLTALASACGGRGDYHLLNVLAAQHDGAGLVIAKGTLAKTSAYRQHCALVDEEMTVLDRLTVKQNLMYGSEMRARATVADHAARLKVVVDWMELAEHLPRQVHSCSQDVRRRVSIARELMLHPAAVFVDSAVEGLATHEARKLLTRLRLVAQQTGAVVVVSLLQPRWALLDLVDDLVLIEGSHIAFQGPPAGLLKEAAILMPGQLGRARSNPQASDDRVPGADSGSVGTGLYAASSSCVVEAPEATLNAVYRTASNPHATLFASIPLLAGRATAMQQRVSDTVALFSEGQLPLLVPPFERRQPHSPWKFCLLAKYGALQVYNRLLVHLASSVLVLLAAVLIGVVYQNQGESGQSGMQNRVGILFFLVSSTFLHNLLFVEATKRAYISFQRHRAHGYFDCATYLCYWLAVNAAQRFVGCVGFMAVVYGLAQLHGTVDLTYQRSLVGIMALTSFASSVLVWLTCVVVPTARACQFVLFSLYAFNVVLAGIVLNVRTLPAAFQDISYASFVRLGYESAIAAEFSGRSFGCTATEAHEARFFASANDDPHINGTTTLPPQQQQACFTGESYMEFLGFSAEREGSNMALLGYITVGLAAVALVAMYFGRAR